jgi:hypothetical protein
VPALHVTLLSVNNVNVVPSADVYALPAPHVIVTEAASCISADDVGDLTDAVSIDSIPAAQPIHPVIEAVAVDNTGHAAVPAVQVTGDAAFLSHVGLAVGEAQVDEQSSRQ